MFFYQENAPLPFIKKIHLIRVLLLSGAQKCFFRYFIPIDVLARIFFFIYFAMFSTVVFLLEFLYCNNIYKYARL